MRWSSRVFSFGLYVIFRSLDGSPESANLPFLRPCYEKHVYDIYIYIFFCLLSQASKKDSGLPSERKKTSSDLELNRRKNHVCLFNGWKTPKAARFSKRRLKRLPALWGSDGRWFVWTLHLFWVDSSSVVVVFAVAFFFSEQVLWNSGNRWISWLFQKALPEKNHRNMESICHCHLPMVGFRWTSRSPSICFGTPWKWCDFGRLVGSDMIP